MYEIFFGHVKAHGAKIYGTLRLKVTLELAIMVYVTTTNLLYLGSLCSETS